MIRRSPLREDLPEAGGPLGQQGDVVTLADVFEHGAEQDLTGPDRGVEGDVAANVLDARLERRLVDGRRTPRDDRERPISRLAVVAPGDQGRLERMLRAGEARAEDAELRFLPDGAVAAIPLLGQLQAFQEDRLVEAERRRIRDQEDGQEGRVGLQCALGVAPVEEEPRVARGRRERRRGSFLRSQDRPAEASRGRSGGRGGGLGGDRSGNGRGRRAPGDAEADKRKAVRFAAALDRPEPLVEPVAVRALHRVG